MLDALLRSYGFPALVFVAVICAPLVEELVFRYALTDAVERQLSLRWANRFQALMFALCHDRWAVWPTLFVLALQAGKLRRETGSLRSSVALHAGWNLLASLGLLVRSLR
jgi:membrane protease YdiL (CAAX protease family)